MALTRTTDWAKDVRSVLVVLERSRGQLRQAEQLVADFALANPGKVVGASITDLAKMVGASEATVLRCCRRLGYGGYPEFKLALARDLARADQDAEQGRQLEIGDPPERIAYLAYRNVIQSLDETMELQQVTQLRRAVDTIANAERLLVIAAPSRVLLAHEAQRRLRRLGRRVMLPTQETAGESLALIGSGDVVLAFSEAAEDPWLASSLRYAQIKGVPRILCTPQVATPLESSADIVLHTGYRPLVVGELCMESLVAELTLLETLITACGIQRYAESVAALAVLEDFRTIVSGD